MGRTFLTLSAWMHLEPTLLSSFFPLPIQPVAVGLQSAVAGKGVWLADLNHSNHLSWLQLLTLAQGFHTCKESEGPRFIAFPSFQFCKQSGFTCFFCIIWLRHIRHCVSTSRLASTQNCLRGAVASWSYGLPRFMECSVISLSLRADHTEQLRVSVSSLKLCLGKPETANIRSR